MLANRNRRRPKASYSIATTLKCSGVGATIFPGLFHLLLIHAL